MIRFEDGSELTELPDLYRLPNAPGWVRGMANLHGVLIPVFDLAGYLGLDRHRQHGSRGGDGWRRCTGRHCCGCAWCDVRRWRVGSARGWRGANNRHGNQRTLGILLGKIHEKEHRGSRGICRRTFSARNSIRSGGR